MVQFWTSFLGHWSVWLAERTISRIIVSVLLTSSILPLPTEISSRPVTLIAYPINRHSVDYFASWLSRYLRLLLNYLKMKILSFENFPFEIVDKYGKLFEEQQISASMILNCENELFQTPEKRARKSCSWNDLDLSTILRRKWTKACFCWAWNSKWHYNIQTH